MNERELREIDAMGAAGGYLPGDVVRLIAEVRRLRARAVPGVAWHGQRAKSGGFVLEVRGGFSGWAWATWRNDAIVSNGGMTGGTEEQAKAHCEAAFLRLVGVGP